MKDTLLSIYRAVAEGHLTQAEALVRIRTLKRQALDAPQGVLLATPEWIAAPAVSGPAQAPDRIVLWGIDRAAAAALKSRSAAEIVELAPSSTAAADDVFAHATLQALAAIQTMLTGRVRTLMK